MWSDLLDLGSALLQSIVTNHALDDGNKRLRWATSAERPIRGRMLVSARHDSGAARVGR